jgi:hypothetical protein
MKLKMHSFSAVYLSLSVVRRRCAVGVLCHPFIRSFVRSSAVGVLCHPLFVRSFLPAACPTGGCLETSWQPGDAVRPRPRRAWWGAGLIGRRSGGDWDGDDLSLTAGSRCATQLDRPGGMGVAEEVEQLPVELERDEVQELPMLPRPGSVGNGGAEEPEEHEQLSAGTAGRGGATWMGWARRVRGRITGGGFTRCAVEPVKGLRGLRGVRGARGASGSTGIRAGWSGGGWRGWGHQAGGGRG